MNQETNAIIVRIRQEKAAVHRRLAMLDAAEEVILGLKDAPVLTMPGITSPQDAEPLALTAQLEMIGTPSLDERTAQADKDAAILRNKAKAAKAEAQKGRRLPPVRDSQRFKGVRPIKPFADGSVKYQTSYWDPKLKKTLSCGTFPDELDAALAVARKIGDEAEIQRISDMIEQRDNDSQRSPKGQKTESEATHVPVVWECNKCCTQHVQAERPKICKKCLKEHGFYKVPPRAKKNEEE